MKLVWTAEARRDRAGIWDYVSAHDPRAAADLDDLFTIATNRLIEFPNLGHPGEIAFTRELTPHRNYRLVYKVSDGNVLILALIHAARQWPPLESDTPPT